MNAKHRQQDIASNGILLALVIVGGIAGIQPIAETVVKAYKQSQIPSLACRACGTVEEVREVTLSGPKDISTVSGEGFAMFFALLKGGVGNGPVTVYETQVQMEDGSVRLIREGTPPAFKHGDQVKIRMGKVKPLS